MAGFSWRSGARLAAVILVCATSAAHASGPRARGDAAYLDKVQEGLRKLAAGDTTSAVAALEEARELSAEPELALYYLGAAQRRRGDFEHAIENFRRSERRAETKRDDRLRARCLIAIAWTIEELASHEAGATKGARPASNATLERVRDAWLEARRYVEGYGTEEEKRLTTARLSTIETMLARTRQSAEVAARIAEREREKAEAAARSERKR